MRTVNNNLGAIRSLMASSKKLFQADETMLSHRSLYAKKNVTLLYASIIFLFTKCYEKHIKYELKYRITAKNFHIFQTFHQGTPTPPHIANHLPQKRLWRSIGLLRWYQDAAN